MAVLQHLTSPANPLLKDVRRAMRRGGLTADGLALLESPKLLEEAQASRLEIASILVAEGAAERFADPASPAVSVVAAALFRQISSTENSQGVLALARLPEWSWSALFESERPVVILDGVQDPGNAGAIVRSAEAFGAGGVVFSAGAASPFHPKTLRAAAGSLFRTPFLRQEHPHQIVAACAQHDFRLLAASAHTGAAIGDADFERAAILIGSEAHGVREEFLAVAEPIRIPTERVESLNAAMAAAVILYETSRRR